MFACVTIFFDRITDTASYINDPCGPCVLRDDGLCCVFLVHLVLIIELAI